MLSINQIDPLGFQAKKTECSLKILYLYKKIFQETFIFYLSRSSSYLFMDKLCGVVSFRHCTIETIHFFFFGDYHTLPVTSCQMKKCIFFDDFLMHVLMLEKEVDIFTEYEYICPSFGMRSRIKKEDRETMFERVYQRFHAHLQIEKKSPHTRFHYCDVRSWCICPQAFCFECLNIVFDGLFEHGIALENTSLQEIHSHLLTVHRLLQKPDHLLHIFKIDKQIAKWADSKRRVEFIRFLKTKILSLQLSPENIHRILVDSNIFSALKPFHLRIRTLCNLFVDAYTLGRVLRSDLSSSTKIIYMGEDHTDMISSYLQLLFPETIKHLCHERSNTGVLHIGQDWFADNHCWMHKG